jgi:hypothetical protein
VDLDAPAGALGFIPEHVLGIAAPPEGVDVRVLEQEQSRRPLAGRNLGGEFNLEVPGLCVWDPAEEEDFAGRGGHGVSISFLDAWLDGR